MFYRLDVAGESPKSFKPHRAVFKDLPHQRAYQFLEAAQARITAQCLIGGIQVPEPVPEGLHKGLAVGDGGAENCPFPCGGRVPVKMNFVGAAVLFKFGAV